MRHAIIAVIKEHVANIAQFLCSIKTSCFDFYGNILFENLCSRCIANLDALRVSKEYSIIICRTMMNDDEHVSGVLALLHADCDGNQSSSSEQAIHLIAHESPEVFQAAWFGLRLANFEHIEPHLRELLKKPVWNFASAAALDIVAFHRLPAEVIIPPPPIEEGDDIAWLLVEAGGRIPGAWHAEHLIAYLSHVSERVREAALRASARSGLPELLEVCRDAVGNVKPKEAISFLGVVGGKEDLQLLLTAGENPDCTEAAIHGLGRLALVGAMPFLLDQLASPEREESASKAIWRITGMEVPRGEAPGPPDDLTEDELDFWEPVAPIDVSATKLWWETQQHRFDPSKRYQVGLCVSDDPLGEVFDQLPMAIRYDVYLRERALTPVTPDWELETWWGNQKTPSRPYPVPPPPSLLYMPE